jgi:glycerate dehydrogenase
MPLDSGVFLDLETVDIGDLDRDRLLSAVSSWRWHDHTMPAEVAARIAAARVVVSNKVPVSGGAMAAASRLELIAVAATGANNIDLEAAREQGITVCNVRDYCSNAVAQHVVTLILNLLTGMPWYRDEVRRGAWSRGRQFCLNQRPIREIGGLRLGVIGCGSIGTATGDLARGLGMEVVYAERRGAAPRPGRTAFEEALASCDVLSIHCPLTPETRDLISREEIKSMRRGALLINTARGGIVNEQDLADCLRDGLIAGAGVDTLSREPPPVDHPLLDPEIPNLIVTPHNAWSSRPARQAVLDQLARVIESYEAGSPINRLA